MFKGFTCIYIFLVLSVFLIVNDIGDAGAIAMAAALDNNSTLTSLRLSGAWYSSAFTGHKLLYCIFEVVRGDVCTVCVMLELGCK